MSHCPYVKKDAKLLKRCQVVKRCHNEVHTYWCQFWHHIWWWPKPLKMCIEIVFEQFWWPSYLTSKLTSICVNLIMWINFFVNLLHSLCVWLFDIWHLFNILTSFWHMTSFWHFDIFLNLNHLSPSQGYFLKKLHLFRKKMHAIDLVCVDLGCVNLVCRWSSM